MSLVADLLIFLIALQHGFFLILETYFWRKPLGRKVFRMDQPKADLTAQLAANQGVYNGFLAAGLLACLLDPIAFGHGVRLFFLACVAVAGIAGAVTVSRRIFFVQGVPAIVAILISILL